ncbi:MAG: GNAT family N-acetyltransferase [Spirulina sp. SIO3F2]|nr:GNAT family N-acetyltransferase [Spirulina sp. SIO3F2]
MPIRTARPSDYQRVIHNVNDWWGGRQMSQMLPKLFFVHFCSTSFIIERDERIIGFLIGFMSQTHSQEAYIHFAGVHPEYRKQGVGRTLYDQFFSTVQSLGCNRVRCVTSPVNQQSLAYHLHLGFQIEPGSAQNDSTSYHLDYDGLGEHRVLLFKHL